eukprot:1626289-Pleurochrysis_carterae.AAC.20
MNNITCGNACSPENEIVNWPDVTLRRFCFRGARAARYSERATAVRRPPQRQRLTPASRPQLWQLQPLIVL